MRQCDGEESASASNNPEAPGRCDCNAEFGVPSLHSKWAEDGHDMAMDSAGVSVSFSMLRCQNSIALDWERLRGEKGKGSVGSIPAKSWAYQMPGVLALLAANPNSEVPLA